MLEPEDLKRAGALCRETLQPYVEGDWSNPAGDLRWSCQETLDHLSGVLLWYSVQLATRAREGMAAVTPTQAIPNSIANLSAVLAEVAAAASPTDRGWHRQGMADRTGFLAMGTDEVLVHTNDIAVAFGGSFQPPADLCKKVVERLFPWAPSDVEPWQVLLWCNGRIALPGRERLDPGWGWQSAPLEEWDGVPRTGGYGRPR